MKEEKEKSWRIGERRRRRRGRRKRSRRRRRRRKRRKKKKACREVNSYIQPKLQMEFEVNLTT